MRTEQMMKLRERLLIWVPMFCRVHPEQESISPRRVLAKINDKFLKIRGDGEPYMAIGRCADCVKQEKYKKLYERLNTNG